MSSRRKTPPAKELGARQVALGYSHPDLRDGAVEGGELSPIAVGLNWHLNSKMRIMPNHIHAMLDDQGDIDGDIDIGMVEDLF